MTLLCGRNDSGRNDRTVQQKVQKRVVSAQSLSWTRNYCSRQHQLTITARPISPTSPLGISAALCLITQNLAGRTWWTFYRLKSRTRHRLPTTRIVQSGRLTVVQKPFLQELTICFGVKGGKGYKVLLREKKQSGK